MLFPKAQLSGLLLVVATAFCVGAQTSTSGTPTLPSPPHVTSSDNCVTACTDAAASLFGCSSPDFACICQSAEDYNRSLEGCILSTCSGSSEGVSVCPVVASNTSGLDTSKSAPTPAPTGMTTITGIATTTKHDAALPVSSSTNGASATVALRRRPRWASAVLIVAIPVGLGLVLR